VLWESYENRWKRTFSEGIPKDSSGLSEGGKEFSVIFQKVTCGTGGSEIKEYCFISLETRRYLRGPTGSTIAG